MSTWKELNEHYTEKLELTEEERDRVPAQATAYFATKDDGNQILFAK